MKIKLEHDSAHCTDPHDGKEAENSFFDAIFAFFNRNDFHSKKFAFSWSKRSTHSHVNCVVYRLFNGRFLLAIANSS